MNDKVKQVIKTAGWVSAAVAFLCLALLNFQCVGMPELSALSLLIAGIALFLGERAKSVIVFPIVGIFIYFLSSHDIIGRSLVLFLLYTGVIFYFKSMPLNKSVNSVIGKLVVLHLVSIALPAGNASIFFRVIMLFIAVFQLVLAGCFISRKYLPLEEIIMEYERKTRVRYLLKLIGGYFFKFLGKIGGPVGAKMQRQYQECDSLQKVCLSYAYSIFVVGLILAAVFIFLASPSKNAKEWDHDVLVMAITQFVGCVICGCFVLSQISCAIKLRGRQIVAGSAPWYLLFVSVLCWLSSVVVLIGIVCLFSRGVEPNDSVISWTLALVDVETLLAVASLGRDSLKAAITFSAVVTIWHLIGCGFVALLIRDNIAKVLSLESVDAPKTEGREAMKEADAVQQQA